MRVLFVGVFTPRSTNVSQALSFRRIGCNVVTIDCRAYEPEDVHGFILREMGRFVPDIVVFSKCAELSPDIVDACSRAWTALWYMDPVNSNWTDNLVQKMARADIVYCNIWESFHRALNHGNAHLLHEGFDPLVDRPRMADHSYNVTFIGGLHGGRNEYAHCFKHLAGRYGDDHARAVCASSINLNFTNGGASDRVYKIMAAGGFLLTEPWPHMDDDFKIGRDLDTFTSEAELRDQIDYYLRHEYERKRIAATGYLTVQKFNRTAWAMRIVNDARTKS